MQQLAEEFAAKKGRRPTKREVEVLVRESRGNKLTEIGTAEVRERQQAELDVDEKRALEELVSQAKERLRRPRISHGRAATILESAFRHVYERNSVAREGDVLSAALELHPDFHGWRELRDALARHPAAIRSHGEMLNLITREEADTARRARGFRAAQRLCPCVCSRAL